MRVSSGWRVSTCRRHQILPGFSSIRRRAAVGELKLDDQRRAVGDAIRHRVLVQEQAR